VPSKPSDPCSFGGPGDGVCIAVDLTATDQGITVNSYVAGRQDLRLHDHRIRRFRLWDQIGGKGSTVIGKHSARTTVSTASPVHSTGTTELFNTGWRQRRSRLLHRDSRRRTRRLIANRSSGNLFGLLHP